MNTGVILYLVEGLIVAIGALAPAEVVARAIAITKAIPVATSATRFAASAAPTPSTTYCLVPGASHFTRCVFAEGPTGNKSK